MFGPDEPAERSASDQKVHRIEMDAIDVTNAYDIRPELIKALYTQGPDLWIDLSQVSFIDSTGLGMLVGVHRTAHEMKGGLHLLNANREVRRLLQVTGLESLFGSSKQAAA